MSLIYIPSSWSTGIMMGFSQYVCKVLKNAERYVISVISVALTYFPKSHLIGLKSCQAWRWKYIVNWLQWSWHLLSNITVNRSQDEFCQMLIYNKCIGIATNVKESHHNRQLFQSNICSFIMSLHGVKKQDWHPLFSGSWDWDHQNLCIAIKLLSRFIDYSISVTIYILYSKNGDCNTDHWPYIFP